MRPMIITVTTRLAIAIINMFGHTQTPRVGSFGSGSEVFLLRCRRYDLADSNSRWKSELQYLADPHERENMEMAIEIAWPYVHRPVQNIITSWNTVLY